MDTGGGDEYSVNGVLEAYISLFRPEVESPSELSLIGGTRGRHGLTIYNYPNSELSDSGNTGPLLEIRLLEEGGREICGAAVSGRQGFACHLWMNATLLHTPGQED